MTDQHGIETALENRYNATTRAGRSWFVRQKPKKEDRRPRQFDASVKDAQTKALIAKLELTVSGLQIDIDTGLGNAEFADPAHFAFPIFVRTLIARRDNIKATIAVLSECP